jgi:hypothetical protein
MLTGLPVAPLFLLSIQHVKTGCLNAGPLFADVHRALGAGTVDPTTWVVDH